MDQNTTVYPYGMNDKVSDETAANKDEIIGSKYPSVKSKYPYTCGNKLVKTNVIW